MSIVLVVAMLFSNALQVFAIEDVQEALTAEFAVEENVLADVADEQLAAAPSDAADEENVLADTADETLAVVPGDVAEPNAPAVTFTFHSNYPDGRDVVKTTTANPTLSKPVNLATLAAKSGADQFAYPGYTLVQWISDKGEEFALDADVTSAKTLYADWQMDGGFVVTYEDGAWGQSFETKKFNVAPNDPTPKIDDPVLAGNTFMGWSPEIAATVTEDVTYTATWATEPEPPTNYKPYAPSLTDIKSTKVSVKFAGTNASGKDYISPGSLVTLNVIKDTSIINVGPVMGNDVDTYYCDITFNLENDDELMLAIQNKAHSGAESGTNYPSYDMEYDFDEMDSPVVLRLYNTSGNKYGKRYSGWTSSENPIGAVTSYNAYLHIFMKEAEPAITYTVTYLDDVDGEVLYTEEVKEGDPTPTIDDPEREGYVFAGWDPEVADTVTEDVTYVATWDKEVFTVTFVDENGNTVKEIEVEAGETIPEDSIPDVPEKDGYVGEWDFDFTQAITEDTTISPVYGAYQQVSISVDCDCTTSSCKSNVKIYVNGVEHKIIEGKVGNIKTTSAVVYESTGVITFTVAPGDEVKFVATANCKATGTNAPSAYLASWTVNGETVEPTEAYTFIAEKDGVTNVTANFKMEEKYKLTFSMDTNVYYGTSAFSTSSSIKKECYYNADDVISLSGNNNIPDVSKLTRRNSSEDKFAKLIGFSTSSNGNGEVYGLNDTITLTKNTTLYAVWEEVKNPYYYTFVMAEGGEGITYTYRAGGVGTSVSNGPVDSFKAYCSNYGNVGAFMPGVYHDILATAKEGYTFDGWYINGVKKYETIPGTGTNVFPKLTDATPEEERIVEARFIPNTYIISFDADGGEVDTESKEVTFGAEVGELPEPTKAGYVFVGWFDEEGNKYTAETVYAVADDITLTAEWEEDISTLSFDIICNCDSHTGSKVRNCNTSVIIYVNGEEYQTVKASFGKAHVEIEVATGAEIKFVAVPGDNNKTTTILDGYYVNGELASTELEYTITVEEDTAVVAQFSSKEEYTISFSGNGGYFNGNSTMGAVTSDKAYAPGEEVSIADAFGSNTIAYNYDKVVNTSESSIMNRYVFAGWNTKANGTGDSYAADDTIVMGNAQITLYAMWDTVENTYWTIEATEGGSVKNALYGPTDSLKMYVQPKYGSLPWGIYGHLAAIADDGYEFVGWYRGDELISEDETIRNTNSPLPNIGVNSTNTVITAKFEAKVYDVTLTIDCQCRQHSGSKNRTCTSKVDVYINDELVETLAAKFGTATNTYNIEDGSSIRLVAHPSTSTKYTVLLDGYYVDGELLSSDEDHTIESVASAMNITAVFVDAEEYQITFHGNGTNKLGGTISGANSSTDAYAPGEEVDLKAAMGTKNFTREAVQETSGEHKGEYLYRYRQIGWSTAAEAVMDEGVREFKGSFYEMNGTMEMPANDVDLYAVWERFENANWEFVATEGGHLTNGHTSEELDSFKAYTVASYGSFAWGIYGPIKAVADEGYHFVGWYRGDECIKESGSLTSSDRSLFPDINTSTPNTTITAVFEADTYTIRFDANGGEVDPESKEVTYNAAVGELPVPTKTGYTFVGWFDEEGNPYTEETVYAVTEGITLTAEWEKNVYAVTLTIDCQCRQHSGSKNRTCTSKVDVYINDELVETLAAKFGTATNTYNIEDGSSIRLVAHPSTSTKYTVLLDGYYVGGELLSNDEDHTIENVTSAMNITAVFVDAEEYEITFHGNGTNKLGGTISGANSSTDAYAPGEEVDLKAAMGTKNFTREAVQETSGEHKGEYLYRYRQIGWSTAAEAVMDEGVREFKGTFYEMNGTMEMPANDVDLYAVWERFENANWEFVSTEGGHLTYGVSGYPDFHDNLDSFKAYTVGSYGTFAWGIYAPIKAVADEGYHFVGWYRADECIRTDDGIYNNAEGKKLFPTINTSTPNTTITAVFEADTYTITFNANGGEVDPESKEVTYNAEVGELPVPTKDGYTFVKWVDADGNEVTAETVYTTTDDTTLTAVWTVNTYTITLDANGGEVEPSEIEVTFDSAIGELPVPTKDGYTFDKWVDADGNEVTAETVYAISDDSTLTAVWVADEYTITFDADGGEVDPSTKTVTFGAEIGELPVPTKTGYTFAKWVDADGNKVAADTVYTVAGDSTLTAVWTANEYTITLNANGGQVDPTTKTITFGAVVGELPVPSPAYGCTFAGWYDEDGNMVTADTVYAKEGDSTFTARWEKLTFIVTFISDGKVIETSVVEYGGTPVTPIMLGKVVGGVEYTFAGWTDAYGNPANLLFTSSNIVVYANYKEVEKAPTDADMAEIIIDEPVESLVVEVE